MIGMKNLVKANVNWSFETPRYFAERKDSIRQSKRISVLLGPVFAAESPGEAVEVVWP